MAGGYSHARSSAEGDRELAEKDIFSEAKISSTWVSRGVCG